MGITHHCNGVENVEYISNLSLLRGMIARPGAGLLPLRGHSNVQGIGTIGVKPVLAEDVYQAIENEFDVQLPDAVGMDTLACLEAAYNGHIDTALIMGGNLYSASPNTKWAGQAMDRIAFKLFMTTTLNQGHIAGCDNSESLILPVVARDEELQSTTQESMFNYVRLSDGGIKRIAEARSETSILVDLFANVLDKKTKLNITEFASHQTIREAIAKIIPGMDEIKDIGVAKREFHIQNRIMHEPVFNTPSSKARFVVHESQKYETKINDQFILMSVRSEGQFNSIIYETNDSYRGIDQRWAVMMNEHDMQAMGINARENVNLISKYGEMTAVSVYPYDIPSHNVMVYYPEANQLIGLQRDSRSQTPAFKSVDVRIEKIVEMNHK